MAEQVGTKTTDVFARDVKDTSFGAVLEETCLRPLGRWTPKSTAVAFLLLGVIAWGAFAWSRQLKSGLEVTGLGNPVFWGVYITNFVFFVGISHAGTLISAILRVTGADWRKPITRAAEAITVIALTVGPINVFFDLGRPDRVLNMFVHGRLESPLMWDVICIGIYFTASMIYLYLPLIPDLAICRDRLTDVSPWRKLFYRVASLGWHGSEKQLRRLHTAVGIMMVIIIPIAVSVHTVVSWVFAMAIQPMWHSTIFGPYFVMGAIFSGIASIIIVMAVVRKLFGLEAYLQPIHFNNLGLLLLTFTCIWLYFTLAEYLTTFYGADPKHMAVFRAKIGGEFTRMFATMVCTCFVIPFFILAFRKTRTVAGTVIASISVNIGMWLERFLIVVPTLSRPRLPYPQGIYHPSWVEMSIFAAEVAVFILLYMLFAKFFPVISIWEMKPEHPEAAPDQQGPSQLTSA